MQLENQTNIYAPQKKQQIFSFWGLVTIFGIFGIIGAVGLPSLLSCGNSGKQAEAKQNIGSMNRAQQAYFLENNAFANSIVETGVGFKTQTVNYNYSMSATKNAVFNYGVVRHKQQTLKSYVGAIFAVPTTNLDSKADKKEMTTLAVVCEALKPGSVKLPAPTLVESIPTCGAGTKDLYKR